MLWIYKGLTIAKPHIIRFCNFDEIVPILQLRYLQHLRSWSSRWQENGQGYALSNKIASLIVDFLFLFLFLCFQKSICCNQLHDRWQRGFLESLPHWLNQWSGPLFMLSIFLRRFCMVSCCKQEYIGNYEGNVPLVCFRFGSPPLPDSICK